MMLVLRRHDVEEGRLPFSQPMRPFPRKPDHVSAVSRVVVRRALTTSEENPFGKGDEGGVTRQSGRKTGHLIFSQEHARAVVHYCCAILIALPSIIRFVYRVPHHRSPPTEVDEASATVDTFSAILRNHPVSALSADTRNRARRLQSPASKQRAARFQRTLVLLHLCRRIPTHGPDIGHLVVSGGVGLQKEHLRISSAGI